MEAKPLLRDEFNSLRMEIKATKARLFWVVLAGLFGIPLLAYIASQGDMFVWLLLPFSVLVLILVFLSEQSSMMRAGRYIRERIETQPETGTGWESWVESLPQFRYMDKSYITCFVLVFFTYYFMTIGVALRIILTKESADMTGRGLYWYWLYGAIAAYAIGAVWALYTLAHHWRSTVSTTSNSK